MEQKKCVEWYVTASKGDLQELIKLANSEPRLVNKKVCMLYFIYQLFYTGGRIYVYPAENNQNIINCKIN